MVDHDPRGLQDLVDDSPPEQPSGLIDVSIQTGVRPVGLIAVGCGIVLFTVLSAVASLYIPASILPCGLPVLPALALFGVLIIYVRNALQIQDRVREKLARAAPENIGHVLWHLLRETGTMNLDTCMNEVTNAFSGQNRFGATLRFYPEGHLDHLVPVDVPFEPRPLVGGDPSFEAIEDTAGGDGELAGHSSRSPGIKHKWRQGPPTVPRGNLRGVMPFVWGGLSGLVLSHFYSGRYSVYTLALFVGTVIIISLAFRDSTQPAGRQWFIVPGGLLLRTSGLFERNWQLHVFRRTDSILCAYGKSPAQWRILVYDRSLQKRIHVSRREVHTVLRAWLSPLPPPTEDQLTDLL